MWFYGVRQTAAKINHKEIKQRHILHSKHEDKGAKKDIKETEKEMASIRQRRDADTRRRVTRHEPAGAGPRGRPKGARRAPVPHPPYAPCLNSQTNFKYKL